MRLHFCIRAVPAAACLVLGCAALAAEPPATKNPAVAGDGVQVGVSKRDGITVDGADVYITRNGATEKLVKELALPSGVIAHPDGTLTLPDKTETTLRSTQILSLDGKVSDIPPDPNVNPAPRAAAPAQGTGNSAAAVGGIQGSVTGPGGKNASLPNQQNQNGGGSGGSISSDGGFVGNGPVGGGRRGGNEQVFVGPDGVPFMGTVNANGSITTADGRTIPYNPSVRPVSFAADGSPTLGTLGANGTITTSDGRTIPANGNGNAATGTNSGGGSFEKQPPQSAPLGYGGGRLPDNGNRPPNLPNGLPGGPNKLGTVNQGNAGGGGKQTNSPNNMGTVNQGNAGGGGQSPNNSGTVNNPNGNPVTGQPATNGGGAQGGTTGAAGTGGGAAGAHPNPGAQHGGSGARNGGTTTGGGGTSGATGAGGASGGGAVK